MNQSLKKLAGKVFAVSCFVTIASCGGLRSDADLKKIDSIDRVSALNRQDYIDQLFPAPVNTPVVEVSHPPVPSASEVLLNPPKPRLGINKTVTLSVTEDVPLKDVFIELARLADVDIEVDPSIQGGVIFKAKKRPFDEVVERITDLAGLRYTVNNGVIRIERDAPYVEDYRASFLNLIRTSTAKTDIDTKTLGNDNTSNGGSSGGSSGTSSTNGSSGSSNGSSNSGSSAAASATGSQSSISSKNGGDGDIWGSIEKNIAAIIGRTTGPNGTAAPAAAPSVNPIGGVTGYVAPPDDATFISLNREAGIITVRTTGKNHEKIKQYLNKVRDYYSSQVLIEAKVIEVSLSDEFRSGVDWSVLSRSGKGLQITLPSSTNFAATDLTPLPVNAGNLSTISLNAGDLTAAVKLAQIFGTTKTLSSPRILVMNNQQAVLNFSVNQNYFTVSCSTTTVSAASAPTTSGGSVTSTLHTIPIGIILGLQPSIDTVNNEVTMNVHPTLSRLTGISTPDPAAAGCNATLASSGSASTTIVSSVPQVDVREMDSILRLKSGEVMAIGGMIEQKNNNTDTGMPGLSDIPVLGYAFKTVDKQNASTQTIIFLKATIVPGYGVSPADQRMYNKFNNDPDPLKF